MLFDQRAPFDQRLSHHISTAEDQQVEDEEVQRLAMTAILERIEAWPTRLIERHDLAVDDRLTGH